MAKIEKNGNLTKVSKKPNKNDMTNMTNPVKKDTMTFNIIKSSIGTEEKREWNQINKL